MQESEQSRHRRSLSAWPVVLVEFARIGATSFGGGSATISAMRQTCLRKGWMDEQAFVDIVVLSRLTPGISILAQSLLIGRAVAGVSGMCAALSGMMIPAFAITLALAELYESLSNQPGASSPLHAVVATAAGYAVAMTLQLLNDILKRSRLLYSAIAVAAYAGLALLLHNPLLVMGIAIACGLAFPALFDAGAEPRDDAPAPAKDGTDAT